MSILAKTSPGFSILPVYARRESHSLHYLSERVTFWVALVSVFAFVTGNMFGQHGWHIFWKSVLGDEAQIVFTGTVPPIAKVPDYEKWSRFGGNVRDNTYRQVPQDYLIPLPTYGNLTGNVTLQRVYQVDNLGTYEHGTGHGSHPGIDIAVPEGTPVLAIANGIVERADYDAGGYGNFIVLKHPNVPDPSDASKKTTLYSIYAHLSATGVQKGDIVRKGEEIGASGSTGFATGPHLHFQMDREEAPWHPYWPFTGTEAREAGLSMTQAVNSGLHRERGLEYTVNPMLFVQSYQNGAPAQTVAARSSSSLPRRKTAADRRQERLARRAVTTVATIAVAAPATSAPVVVHAAASSSVISSEQASSAAPVAAPSSNSNVASIEFRHDGSFGPERKWVMITLYAFDKDGKQLTSVSFDRTIVLRTAYGKAEFRPAELRPSDFIGGKAVVEMLPLSNSTVVLQAMPMNSLSEPMKYEKR